jgi:hypothetical protein
MRVLARAGGRGHASALRRAQTAVDVGLPSDALIELAHGCRLGAGVEVTRPGSGQVPQRRASGRCDARRRGGFAEVDEDVVDRGRVGDEGDDPHLGATERIPNVQASDKWPNTEAERDPIRALQRLGVCRGEARHVTHLAAAPRRALAI